MRLRSPAPTFAVMSSPCMRDEGGEVRSTCGSHVCLIARFHVCTPEKGWKGRDEASGDAPHDKKMCSAIMSRKTSRRPSFDLRLHWWGVSSQNMQHLRWSAVEVGGLGSVWVLSRGAPHQGQEGPPENLFCSVGVKVNFWPRGCPKSAARPASATS